MNRDKHNLKCALAGFILAGFAGFAFSGGFSEACPADKPPCATQEGHPAVDEGCGQ
jgi:hypothetical protein